ncbi:hypothetical protein NFI96_000885 [Prochilodus magdalenae]|nr:hypothetical protein NFI96_000885 [Prochilodus magdalenae]
MSTILDRTVMAVESHKFLGTTTTKDLKWDCNISTTIKKAQQRMYFLHQLRQFNLPRELMTKEGNHASVDQEILENFMLPTLWEQFGDGPFLFIHDCAPVQKASSDVKVKVESEQGEDENGVQDLSKKQTNDDSDDLESLENEDQQSPKATDNEKSSETQEMSVVKPRRRSELYGSREESTVEKWMMEMEACTACKKLKAVGYSFRQVNCNLPTALHWIQWGWTMDPVHVITNTPSDVMTLMVSLESEEHIDHPIEQLTGEDKLSDMMVSEEVPTPDSNCLNSEADSLKDTCHEPSLPEDGKLEEPPGGFISIFALRKHKHTHVTKRPHRCTKCHLSFTGSSQLAEHMMTHRDENFPCDLCDETFSCKSSRAEHRKIHTEQEEELPPLIPPAKEASPPPRTRSSPSLNDAQQNKYRCGVCQVRFQDPEQLSEHSCIPATDLPYSCPECNEHFLHGSHLKKHQLSHQLSGPHSFQCKSCNMSFSQRHLYLTHMRRHGDEPSDSQIHEKVKMSSSNDPSLAKIYKCPICPESFAQALELAGHLSVHSYRCNVCNKTFATKQELEEHEQCHLSPATQYECTECGDSFIGSDAFRQHNCARQKHSKSSKPPPHKMSSSGISEQVINNVEEEEEVDVGEDFYNCPVCNKRFSSSSSLQEHQKIHEDGRPFKCLVCGKGFAKKKYLTQHQQLHIDTTNECVCGGTVAIGKIQENLAPESDEDSNVSSDEGEVAQMDCGDSVPDGLPSNENSHSYYTDESPHENTHTVSEESISASDSLSVHNTISQDHDEEPSDLTSPLKPIEEPPPEELLPEEPPTEAVPPEEPPPEELLPEEPPTEAVPPEEPPPEELLPEEPPTEALHPEEPPPEELPTEALHPEEPATEALPSEEPTPEKLPTEEPPTEAPTQEELPPEEPTPEESPTEAPTQEELPPEDLTPEELPTEAPTSEKVLPEELTSEALPAEAPTPEEVLPEELTSEALPAEEPTPEAPSPEASPTDAPLTEALPTEGLPIEDLSIEDEFENLQSENTCASDYEETPDESQESQNKNSLLKMLASAYMSCRQPVQKHWGQRKRTLPPRKVSPRAPMQDPALISASSSGFFMNQLRQKVAKYGPGTQDLGQSGDMLNVKPIKKTKKKRKRIISTTKTLYPVVALETCQKLFRDNIEGRHQCGLCRRVFQDMDSLIMHHALHKKERVKFCRRCREYVITVISVPLNHICSPNVVIPGRFLSANSSTRRSYNLFHCTLCNRSYTRRHNLNKHNCQWRAFNGAQSFRSSWEGYNAEEQLMALQQDSSCQINVGVDTVGLKLMKAEELSADSALVGKYQTGLLTNHPYLSSRVHIGSAKSFPPFRPSVSKFGSVQSTEHGNFVESTDAPDEARDGSDPEADDSVEEVQWIEPLDDAEIDVIDGDEEKFADVVEVPKESSDEVIDLEHALKFASGFGVSDVAKLVQEEFQKQILEDSGKPPYAQTTGNSMDLWDSLWNSCDPVVNQLVTQVASPVCSPVFCLACDTMFFNKLTLEEHVCPFVSFICSCGIDFSNYPDMWTHSTSHSHKATYVVNHKSAIQNRINSVKEQESKLKVLEATVQNVGIVQKIVPPTHTPSPTGRYATGQTVNLWKRFKPVVKIETVQAFCSRRKYMCAVCREVMCSQDVLIQHVHASHQNTCIYGCVRCGLLLISSVTPKPHHKCGSLYTGPSKRFTVGQLCVEKKIKMPSTDFYQVGESMKQTGQS